MVIIWTLIPILLIIILGVSLANWEQPDYANEIKYAQILAFQYYFKTFV